MNQDRAKLAEAAYKNVETLKKNVGKPASAAASATVKPAGPTKITPSGLPEPVAGMGIVQIFMYIIAGILLLGIILLIVDYWVFPIFKREPGGPGYVSLPGSDTSDNFWSSLKEIKDITIGTPPPPDPNNPNPIIPLTTSTIEGQSSYTITLDVLINDEKPQDLGPNAASNNIQRAFFVLGSLEEPIITFTLENTTNTIHTNAYETDTKNRRSIRSTIIDNVPIHTPFRLGFVKTPKVMEAYLNGLLVHTVQLQGQSINPTTGDMIFAPANIKRTVVQTTPGVNKPKQTTILLSRGIQAMNLRLFPYSIQPNEMQGRMSDLTSISTFTPKA